MSSYRVLETYEGIRYPQTKNVYKSLQALMPVCGVESDGGLSHGKILTQNTHIGKKYRKTTF